MRKLEVEHCDLIHSHSDKVRQIQEKIPEEQEIRGLADFFKVFAEIKKAVYSRIPLVRCNLGYSGLSYMDVVLRPLEDAVLVDIPRLHAVCSRRTGVEQVNDLICAPWPEHSRVQSIVNTQIDLYLWGPTWVGHGRTVLPCLWIIPNGVIKRVKHSSGLIGISVPVSYLMIRNPVSYSSTGWSA